ncbi:hypothetical protein HK100_005703 [Physocladia obscura]|uniref:Uncharacterized protein n=1 Tax=Physocladia obscura TaxID=109957 RepID=A0AAD5SRB7_9FUNG|nr:hypothetical protein HK100_005703 [Physocladia obscura]
MFSVTTTLCNGNSYNVVVTDLGGCATIPHAMNAFSKFAWGGQTCSQPTGNGGWNQFWCTVHGGCPDPIGIQAEVSRAGLCPTVPLALDTTSCDGSFYNVVVANKGSCSSVSDVKSSFASVMWGGQTCWGPGTGDDSDQFWCTVHGQCPSSSDIQSEASSNGICPTV